MNAYIQTALDPLLQDPRFPLFFLVLLIVWVFFWKGLALWHASGRDQAWWFVILLFVNTFGVLEIVYLFFVLRLTFGGLFRKHASLEEERNM